MAKAPSVQPPVKSALRSGTAIEAPPKNATTSAQSLSSAAKSKNAAPTESGSPAATVKARTLRFSQKNEAGLQILKAVEGMTVSKMVNDAVGEYLERMTAKIETDLGSLLGRVQAYRLQDRDFTRSAKRFHEAEMNALGNDPAEGVHVTAPAPPHHAATRRRSNG